MVKIKIGVSSQIHEKFIVDSKLSDDYDIESYVLQKYFSATGDFTPLVISILHSFSEGLLSGLGEYAFKSLLNKISILIKGHVNFKNPPTKFAINISNENFNAELKADNVTPANVDNAIKEFGKIIGEMDKKQISQKSYYDATTYSWTTQSDAKSLYEKLRNDANQKHND